MLSLFLSDIRERLVQLIKFRTITSKKIGLPYKNYQMLYVKKKNIEALFRTKY
jgi:hypothetical protein